MPAAKAKVLPPAYAPIGHNNPPFTPLELERICPMEEIEQLTNLSHDTIVKHHRDKLVRTSPRRIGMPLKHVLAIAVPIDAA
jgi:hypothetical protein